MTNLIQLTDKHYAVKVPVDSKEHYVDYGYGALFYSINGEWFSKEIYINEYSVLFLANTATEEDWKRVVDRARSLYKEKLYADYMRTVGWLYSATESGHSLLQSKGIYLVNPMGSEPVWPISRKTEDSRHKFLDDMEKWQSFEDKVGNYLILERL